MSIAAMCVLIRRFDAPSDPTLNRPRVIFFGAGVFHLLGLIFAFWRAAGKDEFRIFPSRDDFQVLVKPDDWAFEREFRSCSGAMEQWNDGRMANLKFCAFVPFAAIFDDFWPFLRVFRPFLAFF
ncbi:MAG: hypothetical protein AB7T27_07720 [Kiritimatiellia bacterium]